MLEFRHQTVGLVREHWRGLTAWMVLYKVSQGLLSLPTQWGFAEDVAKKAGVFGGDPFVAHAAFADIDPARGGGQLAQGRVGEGVEQHDLGGLLGHPQLPGGFGQAARAFFHQHLQFVAVAFDLAPQRRAPDPDDTRPL